MEEGYKNLAGGIIEQALKDLKEHDKKIAKLHKKLDEGKISKKECQYGIDNHNNSKLRIYRFFKSEWCDSLCDCVGINQDALYSKITGQRLEG